jgi:hypothetical protein
MELLLRVESLRVVSERGDVRVIQIYFAEWRAGSSWPSARGARTGNGKVGDMTPCKFTAMDTCCSCLIQRLIP